MKRIIYIILCLLLFSGDAYAQQTGKVTRKYFPDPDIKINTPAFQKKCGYTGYSEMMDFLHNLVTSHPDLMSLEIVGRTQKGKDIPMIRISRAGGQDKLRVLYMGSVHGNEHAGTEGLLYFMQKIANGQLPSNILDKIDFYIMPMVNIDGSEINKRATNNNTDLNRNQTLLTIPESQTMQRVASTVRPHVFIDFHEYKPLRASYEDIADKLVTNPNDFMFLWSSNPNVAPSLTNILQQIYIPEAKEMAEKEGLSNSTYFTTKSDRGNVIFNFGGSSPRSSSNSMALRGAISMLMEIRGIGLGRTSYKRRVNTVSRLAEQYAETTAEHYDEVKKAVDEALNNNSDIAVSFKSKKEENYPVEMIDILGCKKIILNVDARIAPESEVTLYRPRPSAYYIAPSNTRAIETLRRFGVEMQPLAEQKTLELETYTVTSARESYEPMGNILPLTVTTELSRKSVDLPAGTIRIPMDQYLSSLIATLIEPESANGFVNYRVIDAPKGRELTIYREIK